MKRIVAFLFLLFAAPAFAQVNDSGLPSPKVATPAAGDSSNLVPNTYWVGQGYVGKAALPAASGNQVLAPGPSTGTTATVLLGSDFATSSGVLGLAPTGVTAGRCVAATVTVTGRVSLCGALVSADLPAATYTALGGVTLAQIAAVSGGTFALATPTSSTTVTTAAGTGFLMLEPATPLALLTVAMPPTPAAGASFCLGSTQSISTLIMTGGISDPPPYLATNWAECFRYDGTTWQRITDVGLPSPTVIASILNASTQMNADLAMVNAAVVTMQAQATLVDGYAQSFSPPGPANTTTQGVVLAGPPNGGVAAFDNNGFADQSASPTAYDPYPTTQDAVTAAGTNQSTCTQLTKETNYINGGAGGGVCLPPAGNGIPAITCNLLNGAVTLYPDNNAADTISGGSVGAGTTLLGGWCQVLRNNSNYNWQPVYNLVPNVPVSASLLGTGVNGQWVPLGLGTNLTISGGNLNASGGGGSGITALTGDVTASGTGSVAATLATVNSNTGACGDSTHVCQVTLDGKGRAIAAAAVAISGNSAITALTGDATATGPGSAALTLATVNSNTGACGSASAIPTVTLNAKGLATACTTVAPALATGSTQGEVIVGTGLNVSSGTISENYGTTTGTSLQGSLFGAASGVGTLTAGTVETTSQFPGLSGGGLSCPAGSITTCTLPTATNSVLGLVKPDGTTITNTAGAISVTYGTASNTAAQGNDSRITGALSSATAATTYLRQDGTTPITGVQAGVAPASGDNSSNIPTTSFVADAYSPLFCTGSAGALSASSGTTTLTQDGCYTNITLSGTAAINTAGFRLFATGTLDISNAATNAIYVLCGNGNNASGATGGASTSGTYINTTLPRSSSGLTSGTTGTSSAGTSPAMNSSSGAVTGAAGGQGGAGTNAGGASTSGASATFLTNVAFPSPSTVFNAYGSSYVYYGYSTSGSSGSSGGGDGTNTGGGGGSGATGGGTLAIYARTIARGANSNTAIIRAKGCMGGNGGNSSAGNTGGGGGGGGGSGGFAYIVYENITGSTIANAIDVSGGTGGTGGNGTGTGIGGTGGHGGVSGNVERLQIGNPGTFTNSTSGVAGSAATTASTSTGTAGGAGATLQVGL